MCCFYSLNEKELSSGFPPLHQNKLQDQRVQDVTNINKINSEPYFDLVDQTCSRFNEILINNQDPHSQIENNKTQGQNIPIKIIKKTQKQAKLLEFATLLLLSL